MQTVLRWLKSGKVDLWYSNSAILGLNGLYSNPCMITAAPQNDLSLVYYRALFDYDPTTMSPNPNHHDEIKFKEMLLEFAGHTFTSESGSAFIFNCAPKCYLRQVRPVVLFCVG